MALKYIGGGTYIHGVPARDLTDEEEKEHAALINRNEEITGIKLYRKATKNQAAKAAGGKA